MNNKRFPYVLLLVGTLIMLLYPRMIPSTAPAVLRTDFVVGLAYGVAIGIEILALVYLKRQLQNRRHGS